MKFSRQILSSSFCLDRVPEWTCPWCDEAIVSGKKADFRIIESVKSKSQHSHPEWEPFCITGTFCGTLKCSDENCGEQTIVSGLMKVEERGGYDEDEYHSSCEEILTPVFFIPAIKLFDIGKNVPSAVKDAILETFSAFWQDVSTAGNKIRKVCELIMNDKKIVRTYVDKKGKRKEYSLHTRIDFFGKLKKGEREQKAFGLLMAIKWIGNSGSHIDNSLKKADIINGLEMLHHILELLYDKDYMRIYKLGKEYNKKKGPLKHPLFSTRHL